MIPRREADRRFARQGAEDARPVRRCRDARCVLAEARRRQGGQGDRLLHHQGRRRQIDRREAGRGDPLDRCCLPRTERRGAVGRRCPAKKHFDGEASSTKAVRDAVRLPPTGPRSTPAGAPNKERNLFVANQALEKLATAAQLTSRWIERKAAWDALSKVGGIGAAPTPST